MACLWAGIAEARSASSIQKYRRRGRRSQWWDGALAVPQNIDITISNGFEWAPRTEPRSHAQIL